jgi:hypothetical protein
MIVLFIGPTLSGVSPDLGGIEVRPPARGGDVSRAVLDGATAIGLVDGNFEASAAVWHKEILFALSRGVRVYGAASMGAMRAAECAAFGMVPVGRVAHDYLEALCGDDAAVAQVHAPGDLDYLPLSETLVDAEATIANLRALGLIGPLLARQLNARARALFFKDRTIEAMVAGLQGAGLVAGLYRRHRVSQKQEDALELIAILKSLAGPDPAPAPDWTLAEPALWKRALRRATGESRQAD